MIGLTVKFCLQKLDGMNDRIDSKVLPPETALVDGEDVNEEDTSPDGSHDNPDNGETEEQGVPPDTEDNVGTTEDPSNGAEAAKTGGSGLWSAMFGTPSTASQFADEPVKGDGQ